MTVKLRNPYSYLSARFDFLFSECGNTFEEIAEIELKNPTYGDFSKLTEQEASEEKEQLLLLINHHFGKVSDQDIAHLCPPSKPKSIKYLKPSNEGHICLAEGAVSGDFYVLITLKKDEQYVKNMLDTHNELIADLAFKNAHEGSPFGISGVKGEEVALAGIHPIDLIDIVT